MTTIRVKPRKGIILAGVPAKGADVDQALANEWLDNGLVVRVDAPQPKAPKAPKAAPKATAAAAPTPVKPADHAAHETQPDVRPKEA